MTIIISSTQYNNCTQYIPAWSCPTDIWYLSPLVCLVFLALIPVWVMVARQSPQIREVLRSGWQPVIVAMSISRYESKHLFIIMIHSLIISMWFWIPVFVNSSFGGLILDRTVSDPNFEGMAVFTPVINGKLINYNFCVLLHYVVQCSETHHSNHRWSDDSAEYRWIQTNTYHQFSLKQ